MARTGNQFYATFCANILALTCGLGAGWTSAAIPILKSSETPLKSGSITSEEASLIGSCLTFGGIFGTLVFGYIAAFLGRKKTIFFIAFPQILGWFLVMLAESPRLLMTFRFLIGFSGGGVFNLVSGYTTEISSIKVRGLLGSTPKLFFSVGILFSYVFGAVLPYNLVPWASVSFSMIFLLGFWFVPETPIHLLKMRNHDAAKRALIYYRSNYRDNDLDKALDIDIELESLQKALEADLSSKKFSFKDLTGRHSLKVIAYGTLLMALTQFCGCFALMNFTKTIFEESGSSLSFNASSIVVGIVQILGAVCCTFLVERAGRRVLVPVSAFGMAIGSGVMSAYTYSTSLGVDMSKFKWIPVISFSFVMFMYNWGVNTLPFLYVSEMVETKNKGFTMTFCLTMFFLFATVVIQLLSTFINLFGLHGTMMFFAINSFIGGVLVAYFFPETKGKSHAEIMKLMSK